MIAEALAAPPPLPGACKLRVLLSDVKLRIPAANHIHLTHIRQAHETAKEHLEKDRSLYHSTLQEEYARLQDSHPYYWDQLWPGGIALARRILEVPSLLSGKTVLEFGAGIGLVAVCAALAGAAKVVATDIEPAALQFVAQSAVDNAVDDIVHSVVWDWNDPPPAGMVADTAPFDLVLLPDVLYDESAVSRLSVLAPTLVRPGGLQL